MTVMTTAGGYSQDIIDELLAQRHHVSLEWTIQVPGVLKTANHTEQKQEIVARATVATCVNIARAEAVQRGKYNRTCVELMQDFLNSRQLTSHCRRWISDYIGSAHTEPSLTEQWQAMGGWPCATR